MKPVNHVANAVFGAGAEDAIECTTKSPIVSSDVAPFGPFLIRDLKSIVRAEDADLIASVEHVAVNELTLHQLKVLRSALRLSFRITADFVRDLNTAAIGQSIGTVPIQTIYAVALLRKQKFALRCPRGEREGL